ncbi:MAG: alpha/beta hydrolase [Saprospiraceae bacterium]|nr:alpha/beta hydrolase [Saprospiraceae bacterium]
MNIISSIVLSTVFLVLSGVQSTAQEIIKSEVVPVNDTELYYEKYGDGPPLIFLHGYSLSSKAWRDYVSEFSSDYTVYLIDLTGHGQSKPFHKKLSFQEVASDLNALLRHLKLDNIQAIGFSFGGDILYQLALLNPSLIKSMITIGAVGTWTIDDFMQYQEVFNYENKDQFPWLSTMHASDEHVKNLMAQFLNYKVYLNDADLKSIKPEVMIMIGDDDEGMHFDEIARARKYIPNSDIWILPNVSHGAHEGNNKAEFAKKAKSFLTK